MTKNGIYGRRDICIVHEAAVSNGRSRGQRKWLMHSEKFSTLECETRTYILSLEVS
jgi:hypothetical protein